MKSVCFTGHRELCVTAGLKKDLYNNLQELINKGVTDFYAGGALGWDMLCEMTVIKLRKKYPHIKLHLVLPCSQKEQTKNWKYAALIMYKYIAAKADTIEYTSPHYFNGCMKIRNERLVQVADCCVCYYKDGKKASGTGQTVRMAEKKGIEIINLCLSEENNNRK